MWISVTFTRHSESINILSSQSVVWLNKIMYVYSKEISATTQNHASEKYCMVLEHMIYYIERQLASEDGCHQSSLPTWVTLPGDVESIPLLHWIWARPVTALTNGMWREFCSKPLSPGVKRAWKLLLLCSLSPKPHVRSPMERSWEMRRRLQKEASWGTTKAPGWGINPAGSCEASHPNPQTVRSKD